MIVPSKIEPEFIGPALAEDMTSTGLHRESMGEKTTFNALDNARVSGSQCLV